MFSLTLIHPNYDVLVTNMICFTKKFITTIFIVFFLNSCGTLPGINKSPASKKSNIKTPVSKYSIDDVGINIINLNSLSEKEIEKFNQNQIEEINNMVDKFSNIYEYRYE